MRNLEKYDNLIISNLKHYKEISTYNNNYYVGLNKINDICDLLFAESDDDYTTTWYLVTEEGYKQIGYSDSRVKPEQIVYFEGDLT